MKSQEELARIQIGPKYVEGLGSPRMDDPQRNRENQISRRNDTARNLKVGIHDIDSAILYYFHNVIRPSVEVQGVQTEVPVIFANPEKWQAIQKEGFYRDKNGKRQVPVILLKRDNLEKNRNITSKVDANNPHNFYTTSVIKSTYRDNENPFLIKPRKTVVPKVSHIISTVPDYVKITYSCIILTDYVSQMNSLVEALNYASDSFWGDKNNFKFQSFIDSFRTEIQANTDEDRLVRTSCEIRLNGYILPDHVNSGPYVNLKRFNKTHVNISIREGDGLPMLETVTEERSFKFGDTSDTLYQDLNVVTYKEEVEREITIK